MAAQAESTVVIDNDRTRVTEWRFAPGEATGWHRHEFDYVVVPMTTGSLTLVDGDGNETVVDLTAGSPYFREAGVEHDVVNRGVSEFVFVEIEYR
ncbi:MAG: cupin domain-containing protein [bacterium]|nr:cupin domain-containing protein [bacterium]